MSATSSPFGLNPTRHANGGTVRSESFPGGIASAYGTAIYIGSPVILNTNGTLTIGTTAADIYGVFAGCQYKNATDLLMYQGSWPASATYQAGTMTAFVWRDPDIIYSIQSNGSIAQTAVGDQADFVNPSTGSGDYSTAQISSTLAGAGVQAQLRIIGVTALQDNAWGDAFTTVDVEIARSQYVSNKVAV